MCHPTKGKRGYIVFGATSDIIWVALVPVRRLIVCKLFNELVVGLEPNVRGYNIGE